jgi:hypothetical protein
MTKTGLVNIGIGLLIAAIGLTVSVVSYEAVSSSGGTYFVAWGAVVIGAWRVVLGLVQLARGALGAQPASAQTSVAAVPTANSPTTAPQIVHPTDAMSIPVRVIGILLIAQAATRVVFLAILLAQARAAFFGFPQFVIMSIVLPIILVAGGVIAGALALRRSPSAGGFGLTFCAVGLLYEFYVIGSLIYTASTVSSFHLVWTAWILIPAYTAIYLAGLVVFARSLFVQVSPGTAARL